MKEQNLEARCKEIPMRHFRKEKKQEKKYLPSNMVAPPSFLFLLVDDVGWADVGYNGGIAKTPILDTWASEPSSLKLLDMHSGGTVCSPSRATVLTGRSHQRDCVDYVYDASDPTESTPSMNFAPQETFTIAKAVSASHYPYSSFFGGKWHLGALSNDANITSSPSTHGFDHWNCTQEVSPTATTNCNCKTEWSDKCNYGHYLSPNHCAGDTNPGGGPPGCCFNYWWPVETSEFGGIRNYTKLIEGEDSLYVIDSFRTFLDSNNNSNPFLSQLSFHNCHIPYIGSPDAVESCKNHTTCLAPQPGEDQYTPDELDYYSCIADLDKSVGLLLELLKSRDLYDNTLIMLTSDNGPEVNCDDGLCGGTNAARPQGQMDIDGFTNYASGSAGVLRGRKRDIWEGGHRVPGILSYPPLIKQNRIIRNFPVVTMDFLPTIMDILDVDRPEDQKDWGFDGISLVLLMKGGDEEELGDRGIGWWYRDAAPNVDDGYGYRYGVWKLVVGSSSCASDFCKKPQLYNLKSDLSELHDLSHSEPEVLEAMLERFSTWNASVSLSRECESMC